MICRLAAAPLGWVCSAPAVVQNLASALAAVVVVTAAAWFVHACLRRPADRATAPSLTAPSLTAPSLMASALGVLATVVAVMLLAVAAGRPEALPATPSGGRHVVFVVDVSESATRDRASFAGALVRAAAAVGVPGTRRDGDADVASLIVFAADHAVVANAASEGAVIARLAAPGRLADTVGIDRAGSVPGPALDRALDLAAAARRPSEVILVSDGLWTPAPSGRDVLDDAVRRAAAGAVPIHVFPVNAGPPARGIVAAHLARTIDSGTEAPLRLVVAGGGPDDTVTVGVSIAGDEPETRAVAGAVAAQPLRITRRFEGRGLQFADVTLTAADGRSQRRRLYTTVVGPPRLVVVGAAPWADALPRDRFEVRHVAPGEAFDPRDADVVVIDGVPAAALPPGQTRSIAQAVTDAGTGLFVVNGGRRGAVTAETVVRSYAATPLGPLLPVTADPDQLKREPPPRTVALVIDASGSMGAAGGAPERTAQALARQVLAQLDDRDRIVIDTFPRIAGAILEPLALGAGRRRAEDYIDGLTASGGSDAGEGVDLVARLTGPACAAFIITDGDVVGSRMFVPGCHLSYLEIGDGPFVNHDLEHAARRNGQAEKVSPAAAVPRLTFSYFDPGTDNSFFRDGRITVASRRRDPALAPLIPVDGVAISRPFPQADVVLFRDAWPADPVLAFRHPGDGRGGETGVFMSGLDGDWSDRPDGREAIARHLARLASWQDREHFEIGVEETAGHGRLTVTGVGDGGRTLPLNGVTAVLEVPGVSSDPVPLTEVAGHPGELSGSFELPRRGSQPGDAVVRGSLRLSEAGRAPARIPAVLPVVDRGGDGTASQLAEAFTGGQDLAALTAIADATSGAIGPAALTRPPPPPAPHPEPRHGITLAFATLFSMIAFLSRGSRT